MPCSGGERALRQRPPQLDPRKKGEHACSIYVHAVRQLKRDSDSVERGWKDGPHAVPPTVSPSILSVGCPTPTGTLWPSFPQVPTPVSSARSLPIIETRVSASGPLPISVAPFTG